MAEVGIESTLAGTALVLFSATSAAAVTCGIMNPEFRPDRGLRNAGRPWHCFDAEPNKPWAFAIGVPYTSIVAFFAAANVLGETLILPTDYFFGVPDFPLPSEPSCEKFWGKPVSPAPEEPQLSPISPSP